MNNPYASPFRRAILGAWLRRRGTGKDYNPSLAARIYCRWERLIRLMIALNEDGTPQIGSWWARKLNDYPWRVSPRILAGITPGTVMMAAFQSSEKELFTLEEFFIVFRPA